MAKKEKKAQVVDQTHIKKRSQLKSVWLRFKKNKLAMVGLVMLILVVLMALTADFFFDYEEQALAQHLSEKNQGPSMQHIMGTDQYGRDMFVRVVFGSQLFRLSLVLSPLP